MFNQIGVVQGVQCVRPVNFGPEQNYPVFVVDNLFIILASLNPVSVPDYIVLIDLTCVRVALNAKAVGVKASVSTWEIFHYAPCASSYVNVETIALSVKDATMKMILTPR